MESAINMDIPPAECPMPMAPSIPMGARVGNMIFSSGIMGTDPATGTVPEDLESQCVFAFANMKTMVENAGGTIKNIGTIKVYMKDRSQRDAVNRPWLEMFPDEDDRPNAYRFNGTFSTSCPTI